MQDGTCTEEVNPFIRNPTRPKNLWALKKTKKALAAATAVAAAAAAAAAPAEEAAAAAAGERGGAPLRVESKSKKMQRMQRFGSSVERIGGQFGGSPLVSFKQPPRALPKAFFFTSPWIFAIGRYGPLFNRWRHGRSVESSLLSHDHLPLTPDANLNSNTNSSRLPYDPGRQRRGGLDGVPD